MLRRLEAAGAVASIRAEEALGHACDLAAMRYGHEALAPRVWQLRHNLTAYDATYVALAEALDAALLTTDKRLAQAPGHDAKIEIAE